MTAGPALDARAPMTARLRAAPAAALLVVVGVACGPLPARDVGAQLAQDPRFGGSDANAFSCGTCHAVSADDDRILPGATLLDSAHRASYWGGFAPTLLDAVNACRGTFMRAPPLVPDDPGGRALYEYLKSLSPSAEAAPLPLTIVENVAPLGRGPATRGSEVWDAACASCHGAPHSGDGRISELASRVPGDSVAFAEQSGFSLELVVVEKVRHGAFFGVGGVMPPFSTETLSNEDLEALLAFLGL